MKTLMVYALLLLLSVTPANLFASDKAGFSLDTATELLSSYFFLLDSNAQKESELLLLEGQVEAYSLANDDLVRLNQNYEGMIATLKKKIDIFSGSFKACEVRAEQWKGEAVTCGDDLVSCRNVPWYKSKSFWMPLSFMAGAYAGISAK